MVVLSSVMCNPLCLMGRIDILKHLKPLTSMVKTLFLYNVPWKSPENAILRPDGLTSVDGIIYHVVLLVTTG